LKPPYISPRSAYRVMILPSVVAVMSVLFQLPAWSETPIFATANLLASVLMALITSTIWSKRNLRPLAVACLGCGIVWSLQWITTWDRSILPFIGFNANMVFFAVGAIGLLMTPRDRPVGSFDKVLIAAFLLATPAQDVVVLFSRPEWIGYAPDVWWPTVHESRLAFDISVIALCILWTSLAVGFGFACARRIRGMQSLDRVVALPIVVGFNIVGLIAGFSSVFEPFISRRQTPFFFVLSLVILAIPVGYFVSIAQRSLRRALLSEQLSRRLSQQVLTGNVVRDEFRTLLGDQSLDLFYWSDGHDGYVDVEGRAAVSRDFGERRFVAEVAGRDGRPVALIVGAATQIDHVAMLDSFLASSAIAIENLQLQANIKAQLEQVRESRARIVGAALEERRRIERDLHDGVQQRLLAVQAKLGTLRKQAGPDRAEDLRILSEELRGAVRSLRDLSRGIHPPELRQFGLKAALEVVAERLPLPVSFDVERSRYTAALESTVYFVVCEALTNVVKHAEASGVSVAIRETADFIEVSVADDGNGRISILPGGGLEGLKDRVKTMGGDFSVSSSTPGGSFVRSLIPVS
jgi:signal transduction histidine kinase